MINYNAKVIDRIVQSHGHFSLKKIVYKPHKIEGQMFKHFEPTMQTCNIRELEQVLAKSKFPYDNPAEYNDFIEGKINKLNINNGYNHYVIEMAF